MKQEPYEYTAKWNDAGEPLDAEKALEFILRDLLHGSLGMKDFIEDGCLYCPDSQLTLRPEIESLMEQGAVVDFHIEAPQWGRRFSNAARRRARRRSTRSAWRSVRSCSR